MDALVKKKKINLRGKGIGDRDLEVLAKVLKKSAVLEELALSDNRITLSNDKFTDALAHNCTLKILDLSKNDIQAEGYERLAAALKVNDTLQELYLYSNAVGDEGAKSLSDAMTVNLSLRCVSVSHGDIGDKGAESIAASLLVNTACAKIDLEGNLIGDEGAESLANALVRNKVVELLSLGGNPMSPYASRKMKSILDDPNRKLRHESRRVTERLKEALAAKDQDIAARDEEIARKNAALAEKDDLIRALRDAAPRSVRGAGGGGEGPRAEDDAPANGDTFRGGDDEGAHTAGTETDVADALSHSGRVREDDEAAREEAAVAEDQGEAGPRCHCCSQTQSETFVLMPCSHILCSACHLAYSSQCCPVCRREVEGDGERLRAEAAQSASAADALARELSATKAAMDVLTEELKRKDLEVLRLEDEVSRLRGRSKSR